MIDPADWLRTYEGPAAVFAADGALSAANAAFQALPLEGRPAAGPAGVGADDDWRWADLPEGVRLVTAVDARVARRGRMLATLSHEIRTPLNGVLGMAGLLAATPLDATQRAYLDTLRDSGEHLLGLVNDVLDYAKLDAGRLELELGPTDCERLLQGVCELLSPRAHAAGIEIAWAPSVANDAGDQAPRAPPCVMADDGRLRQILFNLAGNAVKLTRAGGVLLSVSSRPAEACRVALRFQVSDTGPGLAADAQARVFEEFEQAEHGQQAGGAGLGLAIVRRLVAAMGGRLGVDSRPDEGATFWFEADFDLADAIPDVAQTPLRGLRVAVSSGSAIVRAAALAQIAASGGFGVETPDLAALRSAPVDAVLIDPDPAAPPPPCPEGAARAFVLLAPEARAGIATARALGYAGYLIKPLRRASLVARLRDGRLRDGRPGNPSARARGHATPAPPVDERDDERAEPSTGRGLRVLLAEDNPVNALLARALLQREGCLVDRAATGEEAVAAAARAPYDLILMDVRMPGLDGLDATRALRAAGVTTRVVALTANAFEEDRRACRAAGMDDFLTKPLDAAALRAMLSR